MRTVLRRSSDLPPCCAPAHTILLLPRACPAGPQLACTSLLAGIVMGTSRAYVEATLLILFGWIILLKYYECGPTSDTSLFCALLV